MFIWASTGLYDHDLSSVGELWSFILKFFWEFSSKHLNLKWFSQVCAVCQYGTRSHTLGLLLPALVNLSIVLFNIVEIKGLLFVRLKFME